MATQTTGGGSTTSFTNTPQAKDDTYNYLEDLLRADSTIYNVATNTVTLDVMSNDLGGNAKALFSVEDGDGNALTADFDLLAKDVNAAGVSPWEETLNHNWVRINNGKIEYRIADGSGIPGQGRSVDSLTAGESFNDQFVYAIRLGNGTLSEATVKIHITGANDAATIGVVGASDDSVTEAGGAANAIPGDPSAGGTLVVNDADLGDNKFQAPSASSLNGTYGTFTFNPNTGVWAYTLDNDRPATQALAAGAAVTETLTVTSFDGTASYNIVVNVHGTNDNPVAVADTGAGTENQVLTIDVLANDTDVDAGHSFTVTNVSVPAGQGSVSIVGNQLRFDPGTDFDHLAQGATVTVTVNYTMQDEHGASSSSTATITVTGTNDGPTANADVNGLDVVSESGVHPGNSAFPGDPSASGNLLANDTDPDDGAVLTVKDVNGAAANVGVAIEGTYGSITINANGTWSYALNNADSDTQALAQDAHVTESFSYTVKDEWGATSTATLTISITGTNDAPDLSASVTSGTYTDTAADDTFGNISGTLSTVDPDTGDTAAYSVAGGVADGSLLGYDTSKASAYGTLYLNSATGAYRFVPNDAAIEGLKTDDSVGFTLTVTDGHGATDSETLTINIDGANDTPELSASLTAHTYVDTSGDDSFAAVNGTLSSTDRDSGDSAAYSVAGGVPDVSLAGYDHSASSAYGTLYLNSSSGAYTFVPNDGAIEGLKTDDSAVFTLTVTDGSGATDSETLTITLDGANDTPELGAVTDASYNDTAADDTFAPVNGTLSSTDRDSGDSAAYSVAGGVPDVSLAGYDHSASSAYGTLYLNSSSGAYTFVPNDAAIEGLKTTDHVDFVVMVTDSDGASDSDTLTITLNGVNDTPDAAATNGVTTDEDTASSAVAIGASDRDAGEVLTYSVKTGEAPAHGSVSFDQGAGTFVYTPAADYNGSDSFTVLVTDASGGTTEQVVSVTVNAVADIVDDSDTTNEDNSVTTTVLGNDNFEGTPVVTSVTQGTHGSVAINADNTVTYTPNADYNGSDSYTYTVTSGGVTETATVNVTINPVADIADDSDTTNEDTAVITNVLANDSFEDAAAAVTGVTQGAHGTVVNNNDGTVTYTPNADYNGSDSYTYTVTSGGVTETATVNVTINPVADIADDSDTTNEDTAVITNVLANDSFEDAAAAVTGVTQGAHGTVVNNNDGTVTYTPNADYNGSDSYTYTVTSGGVTETATVNVTINPVADIADDSDTTNEDTAVITNVLANDSFEDAAAAVTGVTQGAHGTVVNNNDGTVTYTPNADYNGSDSYTYTVTSGGVTETATVNVTINPVADIADDSDSTNEDTAVTTTVLANDSFEDAGAAVTSVTQGAHGSVAINGDNTVTYTPNADYNGSDSYTYTVTSGGVTETATVNVTIDPVVDIADDSDTTNEDTAVTTDVLANDSFEDAAAAVTGVTQGTHGSVVNNGDGTVTYTPNADYNGSDSYTYTVTSGGVTETATVNVTIDPVVDIADDSDTTNEDTAVTTDVLANDSFEDAAAAVTGVTQGTHGSVVNNNDGTVTYTPNADYNGSDSYTYTVTSGGVTETATVNVTIDPVADIADDADTTNEDTAVTTNVLANDSFEDAGAAVTGVTQGAHGSVTNNNDGTVTYTPNADYNGSDSYTYTVTSGGVTETATVNVTIDPVADIADDADTTNEDTAVTTNVLANDSFEDAGAAVTGVTQGAHGSVTNNNDGTVTYTPNADYNGSDSYTYTVTSGGVTETATVNVTIDPVADIADDSDTTNEDTAVITNVLANDSFEGTPVVTSVTQGTHGSVAINGDNTVTYTPNADYNGSDSYTYTVTSGGVTETATVNVTIDPVADIADDSDSTNEDTSVITDVLANDSFEDAGAAVTGVTQGAHGTVVNNNDGTVTYTPNADYNGSDSYTYTVTSGGVTETATVNVTVNPVNDAPAGADNSKTIAEDGNYVFATADFGFTDGADGDGFAGVKITTLPTDGTLLLSGVAVTVGQFVSFVDLAVGNLQFVPDANENGTAYASFTFQVQDTGGTANGGVDLDQSPNTFTFNVTAVNDAPVITSDGGGATANVNVAENSTAVTTVTSTDVDGPAATYSIVGGADSALFTINSSTGALSFISAPNFESPADAGANNVYDVIVQASDGSLVDTQAIAVTVTNVNEAPTITSNGGGDNAAVNVAENSTAVTTVVATDVDAATTLTYSIVGGADQTLFTINSSTGALSFISAPNFESPTDSGANNVYDVIVRASDGSLTDDQAIAVTVTDVNAAPVITSNGGGASANINVAENSSAVTTVVATDDGENAGTITYSISGGADSALFTINSTTGALSFVSAPNFESPADSGANNVYDVTVQASDGSLIDTQTIAVTVTNVNEAPTITSNGGGDTASISVAENTTAVTTVTASDPDAATTLTYSIVGGADAAKFAISAGGVLTFVSAPNFESPTDAGANNVYDLIVQTSDGTLVDTQAIAVTVTNVNAPPVITSNGGGASANINVAENSTAVTTVTATDDGENSNTLTYSISGGADSALFTINASTGALSFVAAPNFEAPADAGANNVYDVVVRASDGSLTDDQAIAVTVTNVNEAPTITSNGGGATANVNVAENSTAVTTVIATDPDAGTTLTYSIVGGADSAKFTINSSTGALSFVSAPNFESPTDSGSNNVYDVTVRASDGTLFDDQAIAVSVTDVNENSLFLRINVPGPEGQDALNFANFTITIGSTVYHLSDLIVVPGSVQYVPGTSGFGLGPGGNGSRSVVFEIPNAPTSGAVQIHFDYTSSNNGNTNDDGPVFSIGTTATAATLIANYSNTTSPKVWVGDVTTASARTISFNYTTTGSTVNVSSIVDPIIVDLGAHGISLSNTVLFDMDGDGHAQGVSWTTGEDGILTVDLNGDGKIDSGNEVLSPWFNGGGFAHSLDALASLDSNADGVIDANDAAFGDLRVWVDANSDGVTDEGELLSLADLGITSISLGTVAGSGAIDGQNVIANGSFNYADGSTGDFAAVELTESENTRVFNGVGTEDVVGTNGDDLLFASNLGNSLSGGAGNDTLYSGAGDDTLSGGDGNDTFVLASSGVDTITDYSAGDTIDVTSLLTVASDTDVIADGYLRVTTSGLVQVDVDGGGDNWVTVANVNLGSASYSVAYVSGDVVTTVSVTPVAPPIGVDMDGDGQVSFLATGAGATFDYGAGKVATAWVAGNDGILVRDANHDGQASANEIVFATSGSDLQGLAVYDSNHDGKLSSADAAFADFQVWQDANSNGVVDKGEMQSLTALGIASLSLSSDGIGYSAAGGDVSVVGTGSYTRSDGSTGVLADVVFNTGAAAQQDQSRLTPSNSNAALIGAIAAAGLAASEPLAAASVQGESHASAQVFGTPVHDGIELSPAAASAVATLQAAEQMASYNDHQGSPGETAPAAIASDSNADLDSSASQAASAPADLLQATDAPAHEAIVSATPFAAPSIAMPSAEQLTAGATAEAAQHDQVVGQVLADALHGGAAQGPDIDGLLASLPHAPGLAESLAVHAGAAGFDGGAAFMVGPIALSMEMFVAHMDAPAHG